MARESLQWLLGTPIGSLGHVFDLQLTVKMVTSRCQIFVYCIVDLYR